MAHTKWFRAAALVAGLSLAACGGSDGGGGDEPGPGEVFANSLAPGIDFQAYGGSDLTAASVDPSSGRSGASWRILVPASGYAGGTFVASTPHDLSSFNALTFWAKASKDATLNVAGYGDDNSGTSPFKTERTAIALTTTWTKYVIPIPLPARLTAEDGMFHYAEGSEEGAYTIWFDDIRYEALAAAEIGTPAPAIATETRSLEVGATLAVNGASVTYPTPGANQTIAVGRRFFDWDSSATGVATVDADGVVTGVAAGSADITAMLGATAAAGTTTVDVAAAGATPAAAAPTPTPLAADVISLFSNAYTNVAVGTWSASWPDQADVEDVQVAGNDAKKYTNFVYAGIEGFSVDASTMTHFHLDAWCASAGTFKVKLVDYGANGVWGDGSGGWPGDDVEHEVTLALSAGVWTQLEIPLTDFTGLATRAHLSQMILSSANPTVWVDNVYFHK